MAGGRVYPPGNASRRRPPVLMLTFDEGSHVYKWEGDVVPSVTQIINGGGGGVDYSNIPAFILNRAAEIGTEVHKSVELFHAEGRALETYDAVAAEYLVGYAQFLQDTGFVADYTEQQLYSKRYGYAGTIDLIGRIGDATCVADIKTTSELHRETTELQLAAYKQLVVENGLGPVDKKYIIWLKKKGKVRYELVEMKDPMAIYRFLHCILVFKMGVEDGQD